MEKAKAYLVFFMSIVFLILVVDAAIFARGIYLFLQGTNETKLLIITLIIAFIDVIFGAALQIRAMFMAITDEE